MAVGYLNSATLIATVKRIGMIPSAQSTFVDADFLALANQEMRIGLVPSIMQYHQEYYVRDSDLVPLVANQSNYAIPYRSIGGKFREVFYQDTSGNIRAMTRISPDDRPFYQGGDFRGAYVCFYLQGNEVVIVPGVNSGPSGGLIFSFWMRPNELVDLSRVATIQSISTTNLTGTITGITAANPTTITSVAHGLMSGNIIQISNSDSTPSINGSFPVIVVDADTFTIPVNVTVSGTTAGWTYQTTSYSMDQIPIGFSTNVAMDLMQTNPGHKTYKFDKFPISVNTINKVVTFNTVDCSSNIIVGDYVAFAGECIIPQAPSDLHDVLAQRVVTRCLQALGDQPGLQMAEQKLGEMEKYTATLVDNRSEGTPVKINNIRGLIRSSKTGRRGW